MGGYIYKRLLRRESPGGKKSELQLDNPSSLTGVVSISQVRKPRSG